MRDANLEQPSELMEVSTYTTGSAIPPNCPNCAEMRHFIDNKNSLLVAELKRLRAVKDEAKDLRHWAALEVAAPKGFIEHLKDSIRHLDEALAACEAEVPVQRIPVGRENLT